MFGSTSTTAGQPGGSLFAATNPQQQQQQQQPGTGGLFGAQNPTQQTSSLFGNPPQQTTAPSLFGSTGTATNAPTGLFGSSTTQPATGSLFGGQQQQQQPATTGGSLFGGGGTTQPAAGGSLFGGSTTQPANLGGSLFGSTTTQQQQQPAGTTGGGLFGSTTIQQPSGGLFGSTATQQPQQQQAGGLFGSKPGGLFGSNLNISTPSSGPNPLFGGTLGQQPQQQQPATGLFGQPTQKSLFGNLGQPTTGTSPLFGGGSTLGTSTLGTSALGGGQAGGFGASTLGSSNLLSTRGPAGPAQQQADAQSQHVKLLQRIEGVYNAWNANSPQCRFQHTFYNLVNPNQVSLYRQPPNISNEMWEKAARENPDPKCFVPVIATGFDDLRQRVDAQSQQAEKHKERLKDLKTRLEALNSRHTLSNASRLQRAATQQTQLIQRLIAFVQHLHLLIPTIRSSAIRPEEEQLRGQLEEIEDEVRRGRIKGKLNELWALIGAVNAAAERGGAAGGGGSAGEWAVVDEEGLAQIAQILSDQQNGLAHLTKILQKALKDLNVILGSGAGAGATEDSRPSSPYVAGDGESMWSSTTTLRASALR
ncbi:Nucleoporin nup44 [Hypsizygus marmoreus]|uniref:Nucleoporin nup44 n=1 Tax=Hypsizygus marmoreus TaxID=39966 RepID=A0A369JCL0_HYPMA|nr:Nucleoporin nup44 [Hypsizygus marmoreus]